ncbi:hypothetical protein GMLC_40890 [Geomonas limicola]|uniref:PilZ domain-containing protein n=1 Tax=Geomonas limicola TaxID=2740186 RepID=A0A6V8NDJ4_9BACT|nr:PilZ domain-containing protein [Geomonas limicola]GFO70510.1 hypothetical protein GMLC_40890 [Geomonas limicola]
MNIAEYQPGGAPSCGGVIENRCYTRYPVNVAATIWREEATMPAQVVNMSLGGALLKIYPRLSLNEVVTVCIHESARVPGNLTNLPATVVRTTESGCAVRFDRMLLQRGLGDLLPLNRTR